MTLIDAAFEILKQAGKPLHSNEIAKIAIERGMIVPGGPTPESSMASICWLQLITFNDNY